MNRVCHIFGADIREHVRFHIINLNTRRKQNGISIRKKTKHADDRIRTNLFSLSVSPSEYHSIFIGIDISNSWFPGSHSLKIRVLTYILSISALLQSLLYINRQITVKIVSTTGCAAITPFSFGKPLAAIFLQDAALIEQTGYFLKILCLSAPMLGVIKIPTATTM